MKSALRFSTMDDLSQAATQLKVLWKSGRDKFASFFQVLGEVQRTIGPAALDQWCADNLALHISVIERSSALLRDVDAERERRVLREAHEAQQQQERERKIERSRSQHAQLMQLRDIAAQKRELRTEIKKLDKRPATRKSTPKPRRNDPFPIPDNIELAELLEQSRHVEKMSRIECGRLYAQMKELVQSGRAGKNNGKPWSWGAWCNIYVSERTRQDINRCIVEFGTSCSNSQNFPVENVTVFPNLKESA